MIYTFLNTKKKQKLTVNLAFVNLIKSTTLISYQKLFKHNIPFYKLINKKLNEFHAQKTPLVPLYLSFYLSFKC